MSSRFFLDSDNVLRAYDYAGDVAIPTDHTATLRSVIEAAYDGDVLLGGTWDGTTYTPPSGQAASPTLQTQRLNSLHQAYVAYHTAIRKQGWASLTGANEDALIATDKWVYHQIALGDRIARGDWLTDAQRQAAIDQLILWTSVNAYTWYGVMLGNAILRNSWRNSNTLAGQIIYTDLLTSTGSVRSPDGSFTAVLQTIHNNFDPELATLRSA